MFHIPSAGSIRPHQARLRTGVLGSYRDHVRAPVPHSPGLADLPAHRAHCPQPAPDLSCSCWERCSDLLCCACLQGRRQPGKGQRKRIIQRKTSRDFRLQLDISSIMEQRKRAFTVSSIELCNMSTLKETNNNRAGLFHFLFSALMRFFSITKNFTTEYFCPYKFGGVTKFINTLEPPESKIQIHKVCGTRYFKCCCFTVL